MYLTSRFFLKRYFTLRKTRGDNFTQIANHLGKDRRIISKKVLNHRFLKHGTAKRNPYCPLRNKQPYVCNGCTDRKSCRRDQYLYDAALGFIGEANMEKFHISRIANDGVNLTRKLFA